MKKIIAILVSLLVLGLPSAFAVYDASTPFTAVMYFIMPSLTTFSATFGGGASDITFNFPDSNANRTEPVGQNQSLGVYMLTFTNNGNANLNFTHNVSGVPAYADLWAESNSTGLNETISESPNVNVIATEIPPSGSVALMMWANATSGTAGTTTETYQASTFLS